MEKRRLGRTGLEVTVLGFGGAEVGFQSAEQATVTRLLHSALDAGLNLIDTAVTSTTEIPPLKAFFRSA